MYVSSFYVSSQGQTKIEIRSKTLKISHKFVEMRRKQFMKISHISRSLIENDDGGNSFEASHES